MIRDQSDRRRSIRNAGSFLASLLVHALLALLLFSLPTSSSEQSAPESFPGGAIVTVTREAPPTSAPVVARAAVPVPNAPVVPKPVAAAQPKSAPPHPRVLHELAKNNPKGPPNPTPAPVSTAAPNPLPTERPELSVSPAPIPAAVPTAVPVHVAAVSVKVPPTAAPIPKPSAVPTAAPQKTPRPEPSALEASAAPIAVQPQAVVTPGIPTQIRVAVRPTPGVPSPGPTAAAAPSQQHGPAPSPGPKAVGSPGPRGVAAVKGPSQSRPVQSPATPRPAPVAAGKRARESLNQRLQNLIPTAAPSVSPAPSKKYSFLGNLKPTPLPEPTPPPEVIAATKFLYVENVGGQRWKQSILGTAPEEAYVKMYVTSVKRIGFINWCTGYVIRHPMTDAQHEHWIVEPNQSFICAGHLEPFTPPQPGASPSPPPSQ